MNDARSLPEPKKRTSVHTTPAVKGAIIAALANGMSQTEASKRFNLHRNTVNKIVKDVKMVSHEANPLAKDWKERAIGMAQKAVEVGMKHRRDPVGAANIGLKVLYGAGVLANNSHMQVDGNVTIQFGWQPVTETGPQDVVEQARNVTPITDNCSPDSDK